MLFAFANKQYELNVKEAKEFLDCVNNSIFSECLSVPMLISVQGDEQHGLLPC